MKENGIYDKKSLRCVVGKTADFGELAKDCVAFCNAEGGHIDIGVEDGENLPPVGQKIPEGLTTAIINRLSEKTVGVVLSAEIVTAENGGEYIKLSIPRNPIAAAATTVLFADWRLKQAYWTRRFASSGGIQRLP